MSAVDELGDDLHRSLRRTLLPAARVRELSRLRPARAARDTAIQWAIILAAWVAGAAVGTWWAVVVAAIVVGNRYYALFIIGHDGLHRRLFPDRRTNDLFNDLLVYGPIAGVTRLNNRNHLRHHQHLATEEDPDRHRHGCHNKSTRTSLLAYLTGTSSIFKSVVNVFGNDAQAEDQQQSSGRGYRPRDVAIIVGWQVLLFVLLTWLHGWYGYIGLWWMPVFLFAVLGDNLRSFLEHSQPVADAVADEDRLITYTSFWLERAFIAPMHMNFHAAHHLWPSIPYYNLSAADAEMRSGAGADQITWRRSYLAYLWRYAAALPIPGCGKVRPNIA